MASLSAKVDARAIFSNLNHRGNRYIEALPRKFFRNYCMLVLIVTFQLILPSIVQARPPFSEANSFKPSDYDESGGTPLSDYSPSSSDDTGSSTDLFDSDQSNQQFPYYPYITVDFLPPLVHAYVLENATDIRNVPITKINVNYTLSYAGFDSSNQNRSHHIQSLKKYDSTTLHNQFQIEYHLLNHQNQFAISTGGEISMRQKPVNTTYVLDIQAIISSLNDSPISYIDSVPFQYETKVPVLIDVVDVNDNEPESVKNLLNCMVYDNIDTQTPICTTPFRDADRGQNSELTYSISFDDEGDGELQNIRLDPRTGSIYRRYGNITFTPSDLNAIIIATDHGVPYLETSIRARITILSSTSTTKRGFNEKPYIPDMHLKSNIILTGNEEPGTSISNLTPLDPDGDTPVMHIVKGDPSAIFAIDDGSLIVAKSIDFSEKKLVNLTLMVTDGATKSYENIAISIPRLIRSIPNKFNSTSISVSSKNSVAQEQSKLTDLSRFAFDTSYAKYKLYSASSDDALSVFSIDESTGLVQLAKSINYRFNGRHKVMFSIEDSRFSRDHFRNFIEAKFNVNLAPPPPPPTTTTTTTTTSTTTPTTTTTINTTTPPPTSTTTTSTTTQKPTTPSTTTTTATSPTTPIQPKTTPAFVIPKSTSQATTNPPFIHLTSPASPPYYSTPVVYQQTPTRQPYDQYNQRNQPPILNYPPWVAQNPNAPPVYPSPLPPVSPPPPINPTNPDSPRLLTPINSQITVKTIASIVTGLLAALILSACFCLVCRCCCSSPRRKRYRDNSGSLLNRSSFHSQQRLHTGPGSSSVNGSMSRNMNSRLSLRTPNHHVQASNAKALHSKYSAGDSVSLSAMNERSHKHKHSGIVAPPSPSVNQNSIITDGGDEDLYVNAFGPGHPQYLNELRRLKPDYTRMSARLPGHKKPSSTTNVNSLRPPDNRSQSKSNSALPSTPVRTSSHSASNHLKSRVISHHKPLPIRSGNNNRSNDVNGSRTTNTSANVSPSLNDNNSRTALLGSDDMGTPSHRPVSHMRSRQRKRHVPPDSAAEYDDVASHSTVDDTTPQTSSENASISEVPFDARFKTFVRQKKNKDQINSNDPPTNSTPTTTLDRYDKQLPPAPAESEDTENETTTNLLTGFYDDELAAKRSGGSIRVSTVNLDGSKVTGTGVNSTNRLSGASVNGESRVFNNYSPNGVDSNDREQNCDGDYDVCEQNNNNNHKSNDNGDIRPVGRRKHTEDNEDESDDSADEDEEDAEEGVYDLGTSNLFLD